MSLMLPNLDPEQLDQSLREGTKGLSLRLQGQDTLRVLVRTTRKGSKHFDVAYDPPYAFLPRFDVTLPPYQIYDVKDQHHVVQAQGLWNAHENSWLWLLSTTRTPRRWNAKTQELTHGLPPVPRKLEGEADRYIGIFAAAHFLDGEVEWVYTSQYRFITQKEVHVLPFSVHIQGRQYMDLKAKAQRVLDRQLHRESWLIVPNLNALTRGRELSGLEQMYWETL